MLGLYGAQRWEASTGTRSSLLAPLPEGLADDVAAAVTSAGRDAEGSVVEDKGSSPAVHVRRAARPGRLVVPGPPGVVALLETLARLLTSAED